MKVSQVGVANRPHFFHGSVSGEYWEPISRRRISIVDQRR